MKYLKPKQFEDFCQNQEKLIEILNHRMTSMEANVNLMKNDLVWVKRIGIFLSGIISALTIGVLTKLMTGG